MKATTMTSGVRPTKTQKMTHGPEALPHLVMNFTSIKREEDLVRETP